jgi:hypothetical protein
MIGNALGQQTHGHFVWATTEFVTTHSCSPLQMPVAHAPGAYWVQLSSFAGGVLDHLWQYVHVYMEHMQDPAYMQWFHSPQHIGRIPTCCPALQDLQLLDIICFESTISSLTQLKGSLTSLSLAGDGGAAGVVAQLTGLRALQWGLGPPVPEWPEVEPCQRSPWFAAADSITQLDSSDP